MPRLCLLPHRPVTCSLSSFSRLAGRTDSVGWFSLLFTCTFFQFPLSPPTSALGCSPANFNTHHGALGIIQQMPLRRTFLSGTIPLFTLFILKYLRPALIPEQNVSRPFFSHCKTTESEWIIKTLYTLLQKRTIGLWHSVNICSSQRLFLIKPQRLFLNCLHCSFC